MCTSDKEIKQKIETFFYERGCAKTEDELCVNKNVFYLGDDAERMIEEFSNEFDVDMMQMFFSKYFLKESELIFYWIYKLFKTKKLNKEHIPIEHLVQVVKKKKWFDPARKHN